MGQANNKPQSAHAAFISMIFTKMKQGHMKEEIVQEILTQQDTVEDPSMVAVAVGKTFDAIALESLRERFLMGAYLPSVVGGMLAAIIAGFAWGLIVKYTDYEIGLIAIAVGWLCAWSVLFFNNGKKGLPAQLIACGCSIIGILIGKYWIFYYMLKGYLAEQYGANYASRLPLVSLDTLHGFINFMQESLQGNSIMFQLLWIALSLGSAWKITRGSNLPKPVLADADVEVYQFEESSFMRSTLLTGVGVLIICGLFLQLSTSPKLTFEDITENDTKLVTSILQSTPDAQVYFKVVDPEYIKKIEDDFFTFIQSGIDDEVFLDVVNDIQENYRSKALELASIEVPDDFEQNLASYPELRGKIYDFLAQEYMLNYYHKFYTIFFDPSFKLEFDDETNHACDTIIGKFFQ